MDKKVEYSHEFMIPDVPAKNKADIITWDIYNRFHFTEHNIFSPDRNFVVLSPTESVEGAIFVSPI